MHEVENKNPKSQKPVIAQIFETEEDEINSIIENIKKLLQTNPSLSIAILVRNNFQVNKYTSILKENGIPIISRTDCLAQNDIFNRILSLLKFCVYPWKNNLVQDIYKTFFDIKNENLFLESLESPFINIDSSTLEDENLITLHWELNYWLNYSSLPIEQLALKIGDYYCENEVDYSNLYIIAELIRRLSQNSNSYTEIITKLEQLSKRPTIAGLKLFSQDETIIQTSLGGKVQIMTMHKSKGDEFDYVFIPEFTEKNIGTTIKSIKTGNYFGFLEEIKSLDKNYKKKTIEEQKTEILHENLRLLYVTITRAKKQLYFSVSKKQKIFGKIKDIEVSELFNTLLSQFTL